MKTIPLTQGKFALVDDADFEWLNQWKWCAVKKHRVFYAVRGTERNGIKQIYMMHRTLIQSPPGMEIDHINGNGLDNRRSNLRICSHAENIRNQRRRITNKTSRYKGVSWENQTQKWRAQVRCGNHTVSLGRYPDEIDAAFAYDVKAKELFGEFANTNFETETLYETDSIVRRELQGTSVV